MHELIQILANSGKRRSNAWPRTTLSDGRPDRFRRRPVWRRLP